MGKWKDAHKEVVHAEVNSGKHTKPSRKANLAAAEKKKGKSIFAGTRFSVTPVNRKAIPLCPHRISHTVNPSQPTRTARYLSDLLKDCGLPFLLHMRPFFFASIAVTAA